MASTRRGGTATVLSAVAAYSAIAAASARASASSVPSSGAAGPRPGAAFIDFGGVGVEALRGGAAADAAADEVRGGGGAVGERAEDRPEPSDHEGQKKQSKKTKTKKKKKKKKGSGSQSSRGSDHCGNEGLGDAASSASAKTEAKAEAQTEQEAKPSQEEGPAPARPKSHLQDEVIRSVLDASDHYEALGLSSSASENEIKKAYRRRAVSTHPDKTGGDRTAFDRIAKAYEVLSDGTKRTLYDRFGDQGVEAGGNPGGGGGFGPFGSFGGVAPGRPEELFRSFFGGQGGPGGMGGMGGPFAPRNRNARYQMEVGLEDLYNGVSRTVTIAQPTPQHGKRRKTVEVCVRPGMASGQSVVLPGEIDHVAGSAPADVVFILSQRRHPVFTRKGHDLAIEVKLSLRQALCGFRHTLVHLDGRTIVVGPPRAGSRKKPESVPAKKGDGVDTRPAPVIVRSGDVHVLKGEGMPKSGSEGYGDLYVQYKVELPSTKTAAENSLTSEEIEVLDGLLRKLEGESKGASNPSSTSPDSNRDQDDVRYMDEASASDFGRASGIFEDNQRDGEEHFYRDEEGGYPGFGSSFFHGGAGGSSSGFQYFSSSGSSGGADGGNAECRQM